MLSAFAGHATLKSKKEDWKIAEYCKICKRHFDKTSLVLAHHWFIFNVKKQLYFKSYLRVLSMWAMFLKKSNLKSTCL